MTAQFEYAAVILAGGQGSRMGGIDKGLVVWQGRPLVDHVIDRLRAQSVVPARIFISANRNLETYQQRTTVFSDATPGFEGPLRGVQMALRHCSWPYLLVVPCDSPRLPLTLAEKLYEKGAGLAAYAATGATDHPLTCLLARDCLASLEGYLASDRRRVKDWLYDLKATAVNFSDCAGFLNMNTLDLPD